MVNYKERKHTNSVKWDGCQEKFGKEDLLPLWVADMDFEVPECVKDALREYVDFGVFGYYEAPREYTDAFITWEKKYHNYEVKPEWIRFSPGVVPAFNWAVQSLTREEDSVIIMPPVYFPFFEAVRNNKRKLVECPLIRTQQGYTMNYEEFEQKIIKHQVKVFIFCSPHNPVGRIWKEEEIRRVMEICKKHHVYVIADEIHQDIEMSGHTQIPAASIGNYDEILITVTAGTKTFNLAGCQNSVVIIPDEALRVLYDQYVTQLRIQSGNAFGYIAVQSAYEKGRPWLNEVLAMIEGNYRLAKEILEKGLPEIWIAELEGTYLMWIDLGAYVKPEEMEHLMQEECGIAVDYGDWFGGREYACCIRLNLATRQENVREAAERIVAALKEKR